MNIENRGHTSFQSTFDDIIPIDLKECRISFDLFSDQSVVINFNNINFKNLIKSTFDDQEDFFNLLKDRKIFKETNHLLVNHFRKNAERTEDLIEKFSQILGNNPKTDPMTVMLYRDLPDYSDNADPDSIESRKLYEKQSKEEISESKQEFISFFKLFIPSIEEEFSLLNFKRKELSDKNKFIFINDGNRRFINIGKSLNLYGVDYDSIIEQTRQYILEHIENIKKSENKHEETLYSYVKLKIKISALNNDSTVNDIFEVLKLIKKNFLFYDI